jgi:ubiquinone/menaquinone biosynthesis C-methylase UbiE
MNAPGYSRDSRSLPNRSVIESFAKTIGLDRTHSQERYFSVLRAQVRAGARWLDIGCGRQLVPYWAASLAQQREIVSRAKLFLGIDTDPAVTENPLALRVTAVGERLPFRDDSLDVVTANMVFEHLEKPLDVLADIRRALVPGGKLIIHTPNFRYPYIFLASFIPDSIKRRLIWLLERREEKDVFKTFYRANTTRCIRELANAARFEVEDVTVGGSVGQFGLLVPIGLVELLWLKLLSSALLQDFNATIIAILVKPAA